MKVTFIRPCIGRPEPGKFEKGAIEPLTLAVLGALTPPGIEVEMFDDRVEAVPFDRPTDLVAITTESFTVARAYQIAAEYRSRGVPVVLGGMHASLLPAEAAGHADAVVVGDAEPVWAQVLADAARGKLKKRYKGVPAPPQSGVFPRRDLFAGKRYLPVSLVQFSRGCPHACTFCAPAVYFSRRQVFRAIDEVVREIAGQKLKTILFVDDNLTANRSAATELFREITPLKVRWASQGGLDMAEDPAFMDLMMKSGCAGHLLGIESLEPETLAAMGKVKNLGVDYARRFEVFRDFGMQLWAAFTIGHDTDTPESIARLCDWAIERRFAFAAFNILMPYPATPFYKQLAREKRHLFDGRWWNHPDYRYNHAAYVPARMTADELTAACFDAWERFYAWPAIARRALDFKTHLSSPFKFGVYALYNYVFHREMFLMQDMKLGG